MTQDKNLNNIEKEGLRSRIAMVISAISMGFVGIMVDFLSNFPTSTIVLYRGVFGILFLSLWLLKKNGFSKQFIKRSFQLHWKNLLILIIIYPVGIYCYFLNIQISGYAVSAFLLYLNGIFLLIILYFSKERESIPKVNVFGFILAIIGVLVIMEVWNGLLSVEGFIFGLGSALMVAISIFIRKKMYKKQKDLKLVQKEDEGPFDSFLTWWIILTLVIFFLPFGATDLLRLTFMDILVCLLLGLIPTALGFITYNIGIKNDKSGNIVILAYLEPFVATLNTVIFGQYFSIFTLLGGLLIIIANIIVLKYSNRS